MALSSNIVHQYFKREMKDVKIIVKVDPLQFKGTELTILKDGTVEKRNLQFDADIFNDLEVDGFVETGPIEFNLYQNGLL